MAQGGGQRLKAEAEAQKPHGSFAQLTAKEEMNW